MAAFTSVISGDWSDPLTCGGGGTPSAAVDTAIIFENLVTIYGSRVYTV